MGKFLLFPHESKFYAVLFLDQVLMSDIFSSRF